MVFSLMVFFIEGFLGRVSHSLMEATSTQRVAL